MKPFPSSKYFGAALTLLLATQNALPARAAEGAASAEPFTAPGLRAIEYRAPRLNDIAPTFALTDAKNHLWSSGDLLAQQSMALVLINDVPRANGDEKADLAPVLAPGLGAVAPPQSTLGAPKTDVADVKSSAVAPQSTLTAPTQTLDALAPQNIADALREAAPRLLKESTVIVAITSGATFDALVPLLKDASNIVLLRDATDNKTPSLRAFFDSAVSENGTGAINVAAVDRAGFLRSNDALSDPLTLAPALISIGDPTPKLEVGKIAPDFAIPDMNGQVRRLSDLRGQRNLLLTFFPKCFTGG